MGIGSYKLRVNGSGLTYIVVRNSMNFRTVIIKYVQMGITREEVGLGLVGLG
jgi:hypothetical protein